MFLVLLAQSQFLTHVDHLIELMMCCLHYRGGKTDGGAVSPFFCCSHLIDSSFANAPMPDCACVNNVSASLCVYAVLAAKTQRGRELQALL